MRLGAGSPLCITWIHGRGTGQGKPSMDERTSHTRHSNRTWHLLPRENHFAVLPAHVVLRENEEGATAWHDQSSVWVSSLTN